jgi:hypothetical protein
VAVRLQNAELAVLAIWAVYPTANIVSPKVRLLVAALEARLRNG